MKHRMLTFKLAGILCFWFLTSDVQSQVQTRPVEIDRVIRTTTEERPRLDVPYVPTPEPVVEAMLEAAKVGKDDILYDLGCGDGRIVITAAKKYGTRGVGIDIDPQRIKESRENAEKEGVSELVTFHQQDLFKTDISEATVVTLYLLPSINVRLRPKLFEELKPGTRVVSHAFDMGDWEPNRKIDVNSRTVYFWTIPADVAGQWEWRLPEGSGSTAEMRLDQKYQKVNGTIRMNGETVRIKEVDLQGDTIGLITEQSTNGRVQAVRYEGKVEGDVIAGRMIVGGETTEWKATRTSRPATRPAVRQDAGGETCGETTCTSE